MRKKKIELIEEPEVGEFAYEVMVKIHRDLLPVEETIVKVRADDPRQAIDVARKKAFEDTSVTGCSVHGLMQI